MWKARNRLDGRFYAVKVVNLDHDPTVYNKIVREVITLSRLHHQCIVRYYQAWIEKHEDDKSEFGAGGDDDDDDGALHALFFCVLVHIT